MVDLAREIVGFAGDLAGKQRLGQNIVGQHRHVAGNVDRPGAVLVAGGEGLAPGQHRRGEAVDVARREDRRHRLARTPPDLALGRQQAVAQDRAQDFLAHPRHLVVLGVVDQHVANEARVVGDHQRPADTGGNRNPLLVVGRLAPQFERVLVDDAHHLQRRGRLGARLRRGRNEGSRLDVHGLVSGEHAAYFYEI
jgi:hypothetical protein